MKKLLIVAVAAALCGCIYKGAKVTEGTDLCVGISIPASEGVAELNVLNYLSGFRLGIDRNAILSCRYTVCETNSYFGCISTRVCKTMDAKVEPCEGFATETNAVPGCSCSPCKCENCECGSKQGE